MFVYIRRRIRELTAVFLWKEVYRAREQAGNHLCWLQKDWKTCGSGRRNFRGSLRKPAWQVRMSSSTTQRAFRKLHQRPYCIRAVRELAHTYTAEQLTVLQVVLVFHWGNWDKHAWYGLLSWWSIVPSWKIHKQTSKKQKSTHTLHKKSLHLQKKIGVGCMLSRRYLVHPTSFAITVESVWGRHNAIHFDDGLHWMLLIGFSKVKLKSNHDKRTRAWCVRQS